MNQVYSTILHSMLGRDVIESTLQEVTSTYPALFEKLSALTSLDGSNQDEIADYSLHVVDAFIKLKESELYQDPLLNQVFRAFNAVSRSYGLHGPQGVVNASGGGTDSDGTFILRLDTALWITVMGLMCGLKDLSNLAAYSNYANQYLQLLLPAMLHPRYRMSSANCKTVMRFVGDRILFDYFNNFFVRAKVATKLAPASLLHEIEPRLTQNKGKKDNFESLTKDELAPYLANLGLDHGLILGPRPLLFLCGAKLVEQGYDYLLSLNHVEPEVKASLDGRLGATSDSKILIDNIENYYDILDEISREMQTVVCIKRLNVELNIIESFYFLSSLPQTQESLFTIAQANDECEMALSQPCSYLMCASRNPNENLQDFLPQREAYNNFIVSVLSYERELSAKLVGHSNVKPWDEILYRNGSDPTFAMVSLFYYFLADIVDQEHLILRKRRRLFDLLGANPQL